MKESIAIGLLVVQPVTVQAQSQALPAAVTACYSQPVICAVVGATVGGWVIVRNGQHLLCTYANCKPIRNQRIQDPEGTFDEPKDFYAGSPEEALAQCNRLAANRSYGNTIVVCVGCVKRTQGDRRAARYSCTMRVEGR